MSGSMAFQYPDPSESRLDVATAPHIVRNFQLPPVMPLDQSIPSLSDDNFHPDDDQRSPSKDEKIKRAASTPNIRDQAAADASLAASAEKRRNKLGYHRTSVACGHCRRRKIRCILAPGDVQSRCANCIRLKKECNFYPVDQTPQGSDVRGHRGINGGRDAGHTSSSASPANQSGHPPDTQNGLPYSNLSMPPRLESSEGRRPRTDHFLLGNKASIYAAPSDYQSHTTPWMQSEPSTASRPSSDVSYWRLNSQESPITPAFSPFSPNLHLPQQHNWPPTAAEPTPREDINWSAPQRSMSFGNLEVPHQSSYPHFPQPISQPNSRDSLAPRSIQQAAEPYLRELPDTHDIPTSTAPSGQPLDHSAHGTGTATLPPFSSGQGWSSQAPPQYNFSKAPLSQGGGGFAPWYSTGQSLPPTTQVAGGSIQPMQYGGGQSYGGIYYNGGPVDSRQSN